MGADHMLPAGFNGRADEAVDRGTLAVAIDRLVGIQGGVTMRLFGPSPRYALRAAVDAGVFPKSSPNQTLSGGEFVAIMQKAEEYQRGSPADGPASLSPEQVHPVLTASDVPRPDTIVEPSDPRLALRGTRVDPAADPHDPTPAVVYLDDLLGPAPATAPAGRVSLKAKVIGVEGDLVELRSGPAAEWTPAGVGMTIREGAEIRTGPKSAIRFVIPKDEAFCLDSDGLVTFRQAVLDGRAARTRIDLSRGRVREDLSHEMQVQQAGLDHDTVIESPNSALTIRGTKVSLFEQPSFEPVAVSLTGRAVFTNTAGMRVAFGAVNRRHVVVVGNQSSAADQALDREGVAAASGDSAAQAFDTREQAIVTQRGGFRRGDVIVGDLHLDDFGFTADNANRLPGALDFVLTWSGATPTQLNDLNLSVFSPLNTPASPDFVANPPFTVSLTPNSPTSVQARKTTYPEQSPSGGHISANSVGPDGLELAFWGKNHPNGTYRVVVYDLADRTTPPATTVEPVTYTVQVYSHGNLQGAYAGTIGQFQVSPVIPVNVTATTVTPTAVSTRRRTTGATAAKAPSAIAVWSGRRTAKS
jgi:hypothetical protein